MSEEGRRDGGRESGVVQGGCGILGQEEHEGRGGKEARVVEARMRPIYR